VGRDGDESPPSEVVFTSISPVVPAVQAIEISRIDAAPLFASSLARYARDPVAGAVISNATSHRPARYQGELQHQGPHGFSDHDVIALMAPNEQIVLPLYGRFNERAIEAADTAPMRMDVALTYHDEEQRKVQKSLWIPLYERHALRWDDRNWIGAFRVLR